MQFEPSLQLKTRTTPGNQASFATRAKSTSRPATAEEHAAYPEALHTLFLDDIVEIDVVQKTPNVHYNSEPQVINLPANVGCLNWIVLRTRPDLAWATSRAANLITHDPDICFIRLEHICQHLHHTLGHALRFVPIPPQTRQETSGSWEMPLCTDSRNKDYLYTMESPRRTRMEATWYNGGQAEKTSLLSPLVKLN